MTYGSGLVLLNTSAYSIIVLTEHIYGIFWIGFKILVSRTYIKTLMSHSVLTTDVSGITFIRYTKSLSFCFFSVGHSIFCWSFYFLLVILFFVGHSIFCWSFYFLLVILFSVGHSIFCPSICGFCLSLWNLQSILCMNIQEENYSYFF
jgi:hypothetical protein